MILLDERNLLAYLRERGLLGSDEPCRIEVLSGGVSNLALRVDPVTRGAFVVKQSREQLQTQVPWFSRLDRIFRETAMMETLRPLLPDGAIPRILDEDRENYAYAMQAVDPGHTVWKRELLAGRVRQEIAVRLADYLSAIHGRTVGDPRLAAEFGDQEIFEQLRVDPFYRHIARVHPELRPHIERMIAEMAENHVCLVHADFSPKNVLVVDRALLRDSSGTPAQHTGLGRDADRLRDGALRRSGVRSGVLPQSLAAQGCAVGTRPGTIPTIDRSLLGPLPDGNCYRSREFPAWSRAIWSDAA